MTPEDHERSMAEYMRWADMQKAAQEAFHERVSAEDVRALVASHRDASRREIAELDSIFELGDED